MDLTNLFNRHTAIFFRNEGAHHQLDRRWARIQRFGLLLVLLFGLNGLGLAETSEFASNQPPSAASKNEVQEAQVIVFNRPVATFRSYFLGLSPTTRAERSRRGIIGILDQGGPGIVSVKEAPQGSIVSIDDQVALLLQADDVNPLAGETLESTTASTVVALQRVIDATRESRDHKRLLKSFLNSCISTLIFFLLVWTVWRLRTWVARRLSSRLRSETARLRIADKEILSLERTVMLVRWLTRLLAAAAQLTLLYWWLSHVFAQFPYTRPWSEQFDGYLISIAEQMGKGVLGALPGLLIAIIIFFLARAANRFLSPLFDHLEAGQGEMGVLNADTARPTRRLVTIGIWLFALVMAYPYLPGSSSEAFRGMSVLIGLMISLGGSSLFGQAASGLILMYSRTVRVGEYVRISDNEGTVTELGTFTTKLQTGLGEELIIPNSLVLGTITKNYSRSVKGRGYIVDTVVTIGYDTPWRQVNAMLIEAAKRTSGVLAEPAPRVFQTALSDFYPEYRLVCQAVPSEPRPRAEVLAALHANIQDVFNEYGVQIMSPHYLGDPQTAKVVPKSEWFSAPASPEDAS
jgi:small-conductance mechanosensitive channel